MSLSGRILHRNFRFIYNISQRIRQRYTPAGLLILGGIIASGIFGIDSRQSLAFQVFAISISLLLISIIGTAVFPGNFRFRRQLPEYGTVLRPLRYKLYVSNPGSKNQRDLLLMDELAAEFPDYEKFRATHDPEDRKRNWVDRKLGYPRLMSLIQKSRGGSVAFQEIGDLPADDEKEIEIEFTPVRRGYLQFSGTSIARPDPLGLFRAVKKRENPGRLLILPATYRIPHISLEGHRKYQHGGVTQASAIGDSQEFLSLRDYQHGDPIRSIHWRSYAKRGEPVVKEFRDEYFVRQGLVLDTFIENNPTAVFEEAVSLAASFALSMEDQDSLLDLMFAGTQAYRLTTGRSFGKAANMLEILACVNPCMEQEFQVLLDLLLRNIGELSSLIIILLDWDQKRQEMIRQVIAMNIPVLVFIIIEPGNQREVDPGPLALTPNRLIVLPADNMQPSLDRINWTQ